MSQIIITISGRVASGKSPIAIKIYRAMEEAGNSVEYSDHELFAFDTDFAEKHLAVRNRIKQSGAAVGIVVIGTGSEEIPFNIRVEPGIVAPLQIVDAFMNNYGK